MAEYKQGDVVRVDGQEWLVRSHTDEGVMFCTRDHDGAQHQRIVYANTVDDEIGQVAPTVDIEATGRQLGIPNTAGEVPSVDDTPPAPAEPTDAEVLAAAQAAEIERLKAALAAAEAKPEPVKLAKKAPAKKAAEPEPASDD